MSPTYVCRVLKPPLPSTGLNSIMHDSLVGIILPLVQNAESKGPRSPNLQTLNCSTLYIAQRAWSDNICSIRLSATLEVKNRSRLSNGARIHSRRVIWSTPSIYERGGIVLIFWNFVKKIPTPIPLIVSGFPFWCPKKFCIFWPLISSYTIEFTQPSLLGSLFHDPPPPFDTDIIFGGP